MGTASASYTYAGDDNHDGSNGSDTFAIAKASSSTVVTCTPDSVTYTGSAQEICSVAVSGANLSLTPAPVYANNINVGTASASYTLCRRRQPRRQQRLGHVRDHQGGLVDGRDLHARQRDLHGQRPGDLLGGGDGGQPVADAGAGLRDNINVGTASASYTYAGDDNHDGSNGSDTFAITKASSSTVVTCTPDSVTYTGSAQEICSVAVTGAEPRR